MSAALAITISASAQQADFRPVLQSTFSTFDTTWADQQAKATLGNKLVLIAKKYPNEWATNYYAAYSKVQMAFMEQDGAKKDALLDEADQYREEAAKLFGKDNDEMYVLTAMIANARIGVAPQARWQKYGKIFNDNLDKAKALNPDNPRIYLQRGISKFYTPKMFGGGKKAALPYFEKAEGLFAKESSGDITKPYWGKRTNDYFLGMAKGEDKEEDKK